MDYKDKIKKLLALAESPNENEAQAALLKARQLMAEHKIGEADLEEPEDKEHLGHILQAPRRLDQQSGRGDRRKLLLYGVGLPLQGQADLHGAAERL